MTKTNGHGMEAVTVRRAKLTDADKVRYRVYRAENDFIAVIAESALMAIKTSGIAEPYRIVRDIPSEGIAIKAEHMEKQDATLARVNLSTERREKKIEIAPRDEKTKSGDFVPMHLRDLDQKRRRHIRILSPQDLETIAVGYAKKAEPPPPPPVVEVVSVAAEPIAEVAPPLAPKPQDPDKLTPEQVAALLKD